MTSAVVDVLAPRALMLPSKTTHTTSGANGEIAVSGASLTIWNGSSWVILDMDALSGATTITP